VIPPISKFKGHSFASVAGSKQHMGRNCAG